MKYKLSVLLPVFLLVVMFSSCGGNASEERIIYTKNERIVNKNVFLQDKNVGGMKESDLAAELAEYAHKTDIQAINANINAKTWQIKNEKTGLKLNIDRTIKNLLDAQENDRIDYVIDISQPSITAAQLKSNIKTIANYTTPLLNRSSSRVNNIRIASNKINYKILKPGEQFSFNKIVGKRTEGKGYEEAPIIVSTPEGPKYKPAKGGGICQISTTIYNAALNCNLKITERHMHLKNVEYVPDGMDAAVSYGTADLKFINNRNNPIMLRILLGKKTLNVKIIENTNKII